MKKNGRTVSSPSVSTEGITGVTVRGYKCLADEHSIEIRPLTILAGANSSGKSSIMQPLLLLKQTLEAGFDPGALLLRGPHVTFTSIDQFLAHQSARKIVDGFETGVQIGGDLKVSVEFRRRSSGGLDVERMNFVTPNTDFAIRRGMGDEEINQIFGNNRIVWNEDSRGNKEVFRDRCFLNIGVRRGSDTLPSDLLRLLFHLRAMPEPANLTRVITSVLHLPGLRGNPERSYPVTAVGAAFPGTFENYTASVIQGWQEEARSEKLEHLIQDLVRLGVTWKLSARRIDDTQVELLVGRSREPIRGGAHDLVNIADVGFGVSQSLPVLVALHAARPGQLVYLEQPEIHLHPKAQSALAVVLADAAKRGVRVVVETHSDLLLLGIQTQVGQGDLPPELVKLHWFARRKDGSSTITSADLDHNGTFGDWPEDFADVRLKAESDFLNAGSWAGTK